MGALITGFKTKDRWLGVHIYFVPSMSMHPTLSPGDFILLDTWAYRSASPQQGDVVVFKYLNQLRLVKRISVWPDGQLQLNGLWYLLGENQQASQDSRSFGGIRSDQIIGKVKLVLLGIDQQHQFVQGRYFKTIH